MGMVTFGAPKELVAFLRRELGVPTFVETGTNQAQTTVWASSLFENVYSIEGFEPLYKKAVESYGNIRNIRFIHGDSRQCLAPLCEEINAPAIFWLDAHWCGEQTFGSTGECPVLDELHAINECSLEHFVLIDDARLFLAPPPAPHNADHWPDLAEVCAAIQTASHKRYVFVFNDVIVGAPAAYRQRLTAWLREQDILQNQAKRARTDTWTRRRLARIRELLGGS